MEKKYSKDEILEKYLNIAYFGAGANGIEAAAKRFFGVPASDLDLPQAATLAGAVQDPNCDRPQPGQEGRERLLDRRNVVLDRMAELKKITPAEAAEAKASQARLQGHQAARRVRDQHLSVLLHVRPQGDPQKPGLR